MLFWTRHANLRRVENYIYDPSARIIKNPLNSTHNSTHESRHDGLYHVLGTTSHGRCARRTRKHGAQNATSDCTPNVERCVFTFFKMSHNISVMCCLFIYMYIF